MAESLSIGNTDSNLADLGRVAPRTYWRPLGWWWGTSGLGDVAGREAMVNACGVGMAMVQGHNWVPTPRRGEESERGNHHGPAQEASQPVTRVRLSKRSADRIVVGRRARSSRGPGKPVTWRRSPVCSSSSRNRKGDNRECGCSMASHHLGGMVTGTEYADETAQVGDRRSVSSLR